MDYGFRISKTGVDVKTGDDEDMVVTSKYAILKGANSGGGSQVISSNAVGITTITIAHGVGYIPIGEVRVYSSDYGFWWPTPFAAGGPGGYLYITTRYTASNLYIDVDYWDAAAATTTLNYKWFVHYDKGKV